ncbi:MAG: cupin domain-containing protein [Desulforegulaceae bacterium]|nr:cupin domain-containing protein [Desulforegulaceae bacterium]
MAIKNILNNGFSEKSLKMTLVHESESFKIVNFNFKEGQSLPVHSHDIDGEASITILEGEGKFLGADGVEIPGKKGDMLITQIREPHGIRADTEMKVLVVIAPPI